MARIKVTKTKVAGRYKKNRSSVKGTRRIKKR